jgi:hypothetical protein
MNYIKLITFASLVTLGLSSAYSAEVKVRYNSKTKKYESVLLVEKDLVLDVKKVGQDPVPALELHQLNISESSGKLEISKEDNIENILLESGELLEVSRVIGGDGGSGGGGG